MALTRLAHISDIHLSPLPEGLGPLSIKQFLGHLSWKSKRRFRYSPDVLSILKQDLYEQKPDHICVTGDQTNLGTQAEFQNTFKWLQDLGPAETISVIPGNHDAYGKHFKRNVNRYWSPWMLDRNSENVGTPFIRQTGPVLVIGVSSAVPTAPFMADGRVEKEELSQVEEVLADIQDEEVFKVMLIHHPPVRKITSWRRALKNIKAVEQCIEKYNIDLVLHGHLHKAMYNTLKFNDRDVPVLGTAAAGSNGTDLSPSQYFMIDVDKGSSGRWDVTFKSRQYDPKTKSFHEVGLHGPAK